MKEMSQASHVLFWLVDDPVCQVRLNRNSNPSDIIPLGLDFKILLSLSKKAIFINNESYIYIDFSDVCHSFFIMK